MQLIKQIKDSDILGGKPASIDFVSRYASRGVLVDSDMNVAMMYMSETDLYKLPGGGIEKGERPEDAFIREIMEETGYEAQITHVLGSIEEHKNRNGFMQLSYCYIALAQHLATTPTLTKKEMQLGMSVTWMTLSQALEVMSDSLSKCRYYSPSFMLLRDKTILEYASGILSEQWNRE